MLLKLFSSILVTGCFGITFFSVSSLCKSLVGCTLICPMMSNQKITSFCKQGVKRETVCCPSFNDSSILLPFSSNPSLFLDFRLPMSWACLLAFSIPCLGHTCTQIYPVWLWAHSWAQCQGCAGPRALLQSGERLWHPLGAMCTKAGIKKFRRLKRSITGHELSLLRIWPHTPSPYRHATAFRFCRERWWSDAYSSAENKRFLNAERGMGHPDVWDSTFQSVPLPLASHLTY